MMIQNRGIALKLTFFILASLMAIFGFIFVYNYFFSRQIIARHIETNAKQLAVATVNRLDIVLRSVEKVPQNLANYLENFPLSEGYLLNVARSVIESNPEIYGTTIAFEPYAYSFNSATFAPYFYRHADKIEFTYIPYDYFTWDWYQIPKELGRPIWSEPYYDEGAGNILMATYSVPFYRTTDGVRKLIGIVTADVSLSWLQEIVSSIQIGETGYGFAISKNGTFVTHPDSQWVMNESVFSVAEAREDAALRSLGKEMIQGKSGFVPMRCLMTGKRCWMVYAPLSASGWSLGVLFPQDELMADITSLNDTVLFLSIGGFILIFLVIVFISRSITRPLRSLARATEIVATGNLDLELPPIRSKDEVGKLAAAFGFMKDSLKQYIKDLRETTAAKERIESELKIARDIQMGMLPKVFPPFPRKKELDIYAMIEPAKEVGGDLYDFFFLDEDHLCLAIGDVSGKGVPAALFMAITMALLKTKAKEEVSPSNVLTRVNHDLCQDNPYSMFVTVFLGILNVRTGEFIYCNGGHNPPWLLRPLGDAISLQEGGGSALGALEEVLYQPQEMILQKGDTLFLYTDGVTEAMNQEEDLFGDTRLQSVLLTLKESPVEAVVDGVMKEVKRFSRGAPQADDITMVAVKFHGSQRET
jgi:sigma-B regulation protein RsbU (phosphoserine phosphatase)